MGMVPKETKAENKQVFNLTLNMIFGLVYTLMLAQAFGSMYVHSKLHIFFMIACIVVYLVMNTKAPQSPKRKLWQGWIIWAAGLFSKKKYKSVLGYEYMEAREYANKTKNPD